MLFANRPNNLLPINVKIRSVPLNRVSSTKFLGLIIDHRLTFSEHTLSIPKKLSQAFGMIYKLSAVLPKITLTCLYYALFYPHLTFGITVWGFTAAKYLRFFFFGTRQSSFSLGNRDVPWEQPNQKFIVVATLRMVGNR